MNAKEKYNTIINTIEEMIHDYDYDENRRFSDEEVIKKSFEAGNAGYMNDKVKCGMFAFMTNHTPKNYVAERRMMLVYQKLITEQNFSNNEAFWLSGVDSQKGFIAKFKRFFNINPSEAKTEKDETKLLPPKTWDLISDNVAQMMCEVAFNEEKESEKRFGINIDEYTKAMLASNLMNYYGLNQLEADTAYDIAVKNSFDFETAFEYVYGYVWQYIDYMPDATDDYGNYHLDPETRDKCLEKDLLNQKVLNLYFNCGFGFREIREILCLEALGEINLQLENAEEHSVKAALKRYYDSVEAFYEEAQQRSSDEETWEPDYPEPDPELEAYLDFDNYDEDDPDWIEYMTSCTEPTYEEFYYYEEEYERVYDLDNSDDYKQMCEEVEANPENYKGNINKRMPKGYFDLNVDDEAKKELMQCITNPITGMPILKVDDEEDIEEIFQSKYSFQEILEYWYQQEYPNMSKKEIKELINELINEQKKEAEERIKRAEEEEEKNRIARKAFLEEEEREKKRLAEERQKALEKEREQVRAAKASMNKYKVGTVFKHKKLGRCRILEYRDKNEAVIELQNGSTKIVDIKACLIKNLIAIE